MKYIYYPSHVVAAGLLMVVTSLKLCSIVFLCIYTLNNAHAAPHWIQETEELHYEIDGSDLYKRVIYANDKPVK